MADTQNLAQRLRRLNHRCLFRLESFYDKTFTSNLVWRFAIMRTDGNFPPILALSASTTEAMERALDIAENKGWMVSDGAAAGPSRAA